VSFAIPGERREIEDLISRKAIKGTSSENGTTFKLNLAPGVSKVFKA
jgi:hypothetical protein